LNTYRLDILLAKPMSYSVDRNSQHRIKAWVFHIHLHRLHMQSLLDNPYNHLLPKVVPCQHIFHQDRESGKVWLFLLDKHFHMDTRLV